MSIMRRIALSSMLPLREATVAPKVNVISSVMSVRWKGHSQYMNKKGAIQAAGMRKNKMKTLYSIRIFQAVQVFSQLSGVTLLLIKMHYFQASNEPDPKRNRALAKVLDEVLAENLGKDWFDNTCKRAMTKGADEGKEILVEVKGPAGTYAVIECVGKSLGAVFAEISGTLRRNLFVQDPGSARGIFERRGIVCVEGDGMDFDRAEELAIESGAEEVKEVSVLQFPRYQNGYQDS